MTATWEPAVTGGKAVPDIAAMCPRAEEAASIVDCGSRSAGTWQHFSIPLKELGDTSPTVWDLTARRSRFQPSRDGHAVLPDPASGSLYPCWSADAFLDVRHRGSNHGVSPIAHPRYVARKAEAFLKRAASPRPRTSAEAEFYIFNSVRFDQNAHEGYYHHRFRRGHSEQRHERGAQPRPFVRGTRKPISPVPPTDRLRTCASKIMLAMIAAGIEVECTTTRSARPARPRSTCATTADTHGRPVMMYQVHRQDVCAPDG